MSDTTTRSDDGIIHVMPEHLANKIAAGEVVQRPASVAKELIENAIDAGAQSVEVIVKDAGSTLVQVIDDGCGMSPADARRCFQRHATSKIRSIDDLERIRTLGFRGEALASIAAVAQVELKTKRVEDDAGFRVRVEGGEVVEERPCAAPNGTSVAVRNLFYNVPARRNFLKTPATELKHLTDTFQFLALSNPALAFRFAHNGNALYACTAARADGFFDATRQRIVQLLSPDLEGRLVPVEDASSDLELRGFAGRPTFNRKSRGEQFLFINERYVQDRYLSHAVRAAYGDMLPDGSFPFFALFLTMDPRRVDVNVHPTKAEVKFDDQSGIYAFLRAAVRKALGRANLAPQFDPSSASSTPKKSPAETDSSTDASDPGEASARSHSMQPRSFQPRRSSEEGSPEGGVPEGGQASGGRTSGGRTSRGGPGLGAPRNRTTDRSPHTRPSSSEAPGDLSDALYRPPQDEEDFPPEAERRDTADGDAMGTEAETRRRPLWALHDAYLLTPTNEGLMLVDQRAAHLRILYERALRRLREERGESQQLLFPHTFELTPADVEVLEELLPDLRALGFDIEQLSGRTVVVRGVPPDVRDGKERGLLEELLDQFKEPGSRVVDDRRKHLARSIAQKNAVRRGQPLADHERRALLRDLLACEMPYADPTGHPTMVKLSMEELAKRFGSA